MECRKMWCTPPPRTWAAEARAALDKARTNGDVGTGDPFEVTLDAPTDLIYYSMGDVDLVQMDLQQTLPPPVYEEAMRVLREQGLHAAYDCRRELVNFKKVCLHLYHQADEQDVALRQLVTFFRLKGMNLLSNGTIRHHPWFCDINNARSQCKGMCDAIHETRLFTKTLCCIPRHPAEGTRARLDGLPETQKLLWSVLTAARDEVRSSEQRPTMDPTVHAAAMAAMGTMQELQAAAAAAGSAAAVAVDEVQQRQGKGEGAQGEPERKEKGEMESELFSTMGAELNLPAAATYSAPSGAAVAETMRTAGWAPQYVELVQRVLIARGGCKALRLRHGLGEYVASLKLTHRAMRAALHAIQILQVQHAAVEAAAEANTRELGARRIVLQRHFNILCGSLAAVYHLTHWCNVIHAAPSTRIFVAGESDATGATSMVVPRGFGLTDALARTSAVVAQYRPTMFQQVKESGWPEDMQTALNSRRSATNADERHRTCTVCGEVFGHLWLRRNVCCLCEQTRRSGGMCPFGAGCGGANGSLFCPHAHRCFLCDAHSCEQCRLVHGDGEDVTALVQTLQPHAVFLDWDRTLCTTRTGGSPLVGKHSLDPDLHGLLVQFARRAHIVTRNSMRDDIAAFLVSQGVGGIPIHTVKKHQSKATVVLDPRWLPPGGVGLFVDDSLQEHADQQLRDAPHVHRVLFCRAKGTQT